MLSLLLAVSAAFASPRAGLLLGGGIASGPQDGGGAYASIGPILAGTLDWRFGPVEWFLGASATGLVAPYGTDSVVPIALFQGEAGLGFGSPVASGGFYFGAGLSGGEGGFYGRFTVPTSSTGSFAWARRMGGELRFSRMGASDADVIAFLFRAETGGERPRPRRGPPEPPPPPPPPVHHDDPYDDEGA